MKERLIAALILHTLLLSTSTPVFADDCIEKACIEVYTKDGHIVIEGRKGKGPSSTKVVTPSSTVKPTPKPKATKKAVVPVPTVKTTQKPVVKKPIKKASKKPTVKNSSAPATSLQDKLVESIPTAGIS